MDIKLEGFNLDNKEYFQLILNLRTNIFVEELGFDKHLEFDGKDFKAMHYILFCDSVAVGCARWTENANDIIIDRFGILKDFRSKGFALMFVKFILEDVIPSKKKILLYTIADNLEFFKHFGFTDAQLIEKVGKKEYHVLNF